ncbi:hypothetical protein ACFX19_010459 [Malus domestica]
MNDPAKRKRVGQETEVHHLAQECPQSHNNRRPSWDSAAGNPCSNACWNFRISGAVMKARKRGRVFSSLQVTPCNSSSPRKPLCCTESKPTGMYTSGSLRTFLSGTRTSFLSRSVTLYV